MRPILALAVALACSCTAPAIAEPTKAKPAIATPAPPKAPDPIDPRDALMVQNRQLTVEKLEAQLQLARAALGQINGEFVERYKVDLKAGDRVDLEKLTITRAKDAKK